MATQTRVQSGTSRSRSTSSKGKARKKQKQPFVTLWSVRLRSFFSGMVPSITISDRLKREIAGILLVLVSTTIVRGWQAVNTDGDLGRHIRSHRMLGRSPLQQGHHHDHL